MSQSEINPARNERHRAYRQHGRESILIVLVSICCIVTADNYFRTSRAMDASNEAKASSEVWQTMYSETERECRLAQMEIDDFRIIMAKTGFDEHVGVKP